MSACDKNVWQPVYLLWLRLLLQGLKMSNCQEMWGSHCLCLCINLTWSLLLLPLWTLNHISDRCTPGKSEHTDTVTCRRKASFTNLVLSAQLSMKNTYNICLTTIKSQRQEGDNYSAAKKMLALVCIPAILTITRTIKQRIYFIFLFVLLMSINRNQWLTKSTDLHYLEKEHTYCTRCISSTSLSFESSS